MESSRPPTYPPTATTRLPRSGVAASNGALVAGLITAMLMGGAGGLYYWLQTRDGQAPEIRPTPEPVIVSEPAAVSNRASAPDPVASESPRGDEPTVTIKALVHGLMKRDVEAVSALLGDQLGKSEKAALIAALENAVVTIDQKQPVTDIGHVGLMDRWAVNLLNPTTGEKHPLTLDFEREESGGWVIANVHLPKELRQGANRPSAVISQAEAFLGRLIDRDFGSLREFALEENVPNEKLAALGIIFDEAKFRLADERSLRTPNVSEDRAWIIARVHSDEYQVDSEFGLEMKKVGESWLIERINLSRLMRAFTTVAGGEDAFNPPAGGDSIVLYFGYDDDKLTSRSLKQLSVVASILKSSGEKRIQIGGHADALGEDGYNDALSQRRARRVAEALRALGVRPSQLKLEAFGERLPLSPNLNPDGSDNPAGRGRNRRAEIYLDF